ncbi:suppressor APC domain-containing protein 1 isoform B [Alligator mississippiensis]|uniref:Suppressor APC domain-containing protein 1 isoform B n=1 Tax=Alligator mississippiensis TaxID=8496 RepID=A0A151NRK3_ALLMI|nr:suppressor APC domain-containing protein 1 isoform B [Alligator mississippiensis]
MAARGYTVLILPLGSALGSWDALRGFLRLRRLQGLERERDALLQGLELAERLRAWCQRHLQAAQRRRRHAQRAGADYLGDSGSDHSCLLLAKIQEVNQCLEKLFAGARKGSTPPCSHQDQARDPPVPLWKRLEFQQQTLSVLREQNRLLIKEASAKSERIARLEREKALLVQLLRETQGGRSTAHRAPMFL